VVVLEQPKLTGRPQSAGLLVRTVGQVLVCLAHRVGDKMASMRYRATCRGLGSLGSAILATLAACSAAQRPRAACDLIAAAGVRSLLAVTAVTPLAVDGGCRWDTPAPGRSVLLSFEGGDPLLAATADPRTATTWNIGDGGATAAKASHATAVVRYRSTVVAVDVNGLDERAGQAAARALAGPVIKALQAGWAPPKPTDSPSPW